MATQSKFALTGGDPNRLHVLVLDGGGVRGVSSLVVLKALLNEVKRHVHAHTGKDPGPLKPHNVFDLAVGTSTGGLISIMIGKLGLSVDECIDEYRALSAVIFKEGRHLRGKLTAGILRERYSGKVLSREIKSLFQRYDRSADERMTTSHLLPPNESAHCSVVCKQVDRLPDGEHIRPGQVFICSHPCSGIRCTVCVAARATTAAPTYFKPQKIERDRLLDIYLVDGGLGCNNPTVRAWFHYRGESHSELGWRGSLLISLGTGLYDRNTYHPPKRTQLQKRIRIPTAIQLMKEATTDPQEADEEMQILAGTNGEGINYYRFSATTGVCWIKMDDYKKLDYIIHQTEEYLRIGQVRRQLGNCAIEIARDYVSKLGSVNGNGSAHGL